MKFNEIPNEIKPNIPIKIDFTEYSKTVDEVKYPILKLNNVEVVRCIEPMEFLSISNITKYYGEYNLGLVYSNNIRLIIKNEELEVFEKEYIVLDINELSYTDGLQEITINKNRLNEFGVRKWI